MKENKPSRRSVMFLPWVGGSGTPIRPLQADSLPGSGHALLKRVAARYEHGNRFLLVRVNLTSESSSDFGNLPVQQRMLVAVHNKLVRVEREAILGAVYVVGEDTTWEYRPDLKQYIQRPLDHVRTRDFRELGRSWAFTLAQRFALLDKLDVTTTFDGSELVKASGKKYKCEVVRLEPNDKKLWIEKLWIDDTEVVRKSEMNRKAHRDKDSLFMPGLTQTHWTDVRLEVPPDPELFVFRPPRGVRQVSGFTFRSYGGH